LHCETVCQVKARGKAILTRFSNGLTLYTHNQPYGRWLITTGGEYPDSSRQLRLAIHTGDHTALLYSASDISILNEAELRQHPYVYRRAGLPCYRCGTDIIKGTFCGRMGYLCPTCQGRSGTGGDIQRE
jgi:formamidopyrimidine-DNA glycosylase